MRVGLVFMTILVLSHVCQSLLFAPKKKPLFQKAEKKPKNPMMKDGMKIVNTLVEKKKEN